MIIMKNYKKHILIIFIAIFVFILFQSVTVLGAADSDAYKDGYTNGLWEGGDAAYDDLEDGFKKNFRKAMPKEDEIISRYDLDKVSNNDKRDFIRGYKEGFELGYNNTYDNPKIEFTPTNYDKVVGYAMGEAAGLSDFYAGKKNKWAEAVPSAAKLVELFGLKNETTAYKNDFILNYKKEFQTAYELAYKNAKFEPMANDALRGYEDGDKIGKLMGADYGRKDFSGNKNIDWKRNLPSDNDLKKTFSLHNEVPDYVKSFLSAFKRSFEDRYNDSYRDAGVEYYSSLFEDAYNNGNSLGQMKGSSIANVDYMMGKPNSIEKYNFTDENLTIEYRLHNENKRYRDSFIAGFNEGFRIGYIKTYQLISTASFGEKITEEIIPIGGGYISSGDNKLYATFDKGTFYNDVVASLDKYMQTTNTIVMPDSNSFIRNSDLYLFKVHNDRVEYDNDKAVELSFEYYGGMNGGIYRFKYGVWDYIPSKIAENSITAYVSPKLAQESSIYGVFIDKKAIIPLDLRGHWAREEAITALKRGYTGLYSDNTFRPDTPVSKAQLLLYLSWADKWKVNITEEDLSVVEGLVDFEEIKGIKELVAYSIKKGYLGISNNRFNSGESICYSQLEKIIQKVKMNNSFTWKWVSDKMAMIKDKRCSSLDSMNNKVTRAEFIYLLNLLNDN